MAAKRYVSTGEMAQALGTTARNVGYYCHDSAFPGAFQTLGGHWRIPMKLYLEASEANLTGKVNDLQPKPEEPEKQEEPEEPESTPLTGR